MLRENLHLHSPTSCLFLCQHGLFKLKLLLYFFSLCCILVCFYFASLLQLFDHTLTHMDTISLTKHSFPGGERVCLSVVEVSVLLSAQNIKCFNHMHTCAPLQCKHLPAFGQRERHSKRFCF